MGINQRPREPSRLPNVCILRTPAKSGVLSVGRIGGTLKNSCHVRTGDGSPDHR